MFSFNEVILVLGTNTGIGKATATELARRRTRVIRGCGDHHRGKAVARMIKTK